MFCNRSLLKMEGSDMKYVRQFCIILLITFLGEILNAVIPLPIPAGIYGLVLMLILLLSGVVKLEQVEDVGLFLVEIMPIMFIPSVAGLVDSFDQLQGILIPFLLAVLAATCIVMAVSGKVTQAVLRRKGKKS